MYKTGKYPCFFDSLRLRESKNKDKLSIKGEDVKKYNQSLVDRKQIKSNYTALWHCILYGSLKKIFF